MITWSILNADVWTHDGKTDVIDAINWRCTWQVDGKEVAVEDGRVSIPYDKNTRFVQFADLTEAELTAMAHVAMGGAVATVEARLIRRATIRNETPPKVAERLAVEAEAKRSRPSAEVSEAVAIK